MKIMGLFDEQDSKDDQKMWNLLVFNMYTTNEERDKVMPWVGITVIILVIIVGLFMIF